MAQPSQARTFGQTAEPRIFTDAALGQHDSCGSVRKDRSLGRRRWLFSERAPD